MSVNFAELKVSVQLLVGFGGTDYALSNGTGANLQANGQFISAGSGNGAGLTTVLGGACSSSALCAGNISGFLAGPGASHAGVSYGFPTTPGGVEIVNGVAAFTKGP